jgi:hypothetical protein
MDSDRLRAQYLLELRAGAERRFGAVRAAALEALIADAAGWMAEVATYPVDAEEPPAFYAEPSS